MPPSTMAHSGETTSAAGGDGDQTGVTIPGSGTHSGVVAGVRIFGEAPVKWRTKDEIQDSLCLVVTVGDDTKHPN